MADALTVDVIVPVREMLPQGASRQFIMGSVAEVDMRLRQLICRTLAGEIVLGFDHLVLAFGNRARIDLMPGMAEHALPPKTVGALPFRPANTAIGADRSTPGNTWYQVGVNAADMPK